MTVFNPNCAMICNLSIFGSKIDKNNAINQVFQAKTGPKMYQFCPVGQPFVRAIICPLPYCKLFNSFIKIHFVLCFFLKNFFFLNSRTCLESIQLMNFLHYDRGNSSKIQPNRIESFSFSQKMNLIQRGQQVTSGVQSVKLTTSS